MPRACCSAFRKSATQVLAVATKPLPSPSAKRTARAMAQEVAKPNNSEHSTMVKHANTSTGFRPLHQWRGLGVSPPWIEFAFLHVPFISNISPKDRRWDTSQHKSGGDVTSCIMAVIIPLKLMDAFSYQENVPHRIRQLDRCCPPFSCRLSVNTHNCTHTSA